MQLESKNLTELLIRLGIKTGVQWRIVYPNEIYEGLHGFAIDTSSDFFKMNLKEFGSSENLDDCILTTVEHFKSGNVKLLDIAFEKLFINHYPTKTLFGEMYDISIGAIIDHYKGHLLMVLADLGLVLVAFVPGGVIFDETMLSARIAKGLEYAKETLDTKKWLSGLKSAAEENNSRLYLVKYRIIKAGLEKTKIGAATKEAIKIIENSPLLTKPKLFLFGSGFVFTGNVLESLCEEGGSYSSFIKGINSGVLDLISFILTANTVSEANSFVAATIKPDVIKLNKYFDNFSQHAASTSATGAALYLAKQRRMSHICKITNWEAHE